jgi:hypothetical protein
MEFPEELGLELKGFVGVGRSESEMSSWPLARRCSLSWLAGTTRLLPSSTSASPAHDFSFIVQS